jgi:hypothetical protein
MPTCDQRTLSPAERQREIASILARGVIRWRRRAKAGAIIDAPESRRNRENRLELSRRTRLSVSTRGFTPRRHGDEV